VYFSQKAKALQTYYPQIGQYQLAVYDRETTEIHPTSNTQGGGLRPALSPDGRWLVYASRYHADTGLRLRDLATDEESWLLHPVQLDVQGAQHASWDLMPGTSFTPDSKSLTLDISRLESAGITALASFGSDRVGARQASLASALSRGG
jgi:Tol biopolymer transport system component